MEAYETYTLSGPQLDGLGKLESRLPAPARKTGVAALFLVLVMLLTLFGVGGAKLRGQKSRVEELYLSGTEYDDSITTDLAARSAAAANIITVGRGLLGDSTEVQNAQAALDALTVASGPAAQYAANTRLASAIDLLYQRARPAADAADKGKALQTQWSEFLSRNDIIGHDGYNEAAAAYNRMAGGFPANLEGALWGAGKVELYQ